MLEELGLQNFVLIKEANLTFSQGLTVLTGETGAGKSLLVQAIKLVLGERASPQHIRAGEEQAMVQALFDIPKEEWGRFEAMGISCDEGIIIRRLISRSGRSRIYVNGAIFTLQDLKRVTSRLVSLASQHEYQELTKRENHIHWLDIFGGLKKEVLHFENEFKGLKKLKKELEEARSKREKAEELLERYTNELKLIEEISPRPGEDEELEQEKRVLKSAADLRSLGEECYQNLYAGKGSVHEIIATCAKTLEKMSFLDETLNRQLEELRSITYQTEEVSWSIRDYIHNLPTDLTRLDQIEERIFRIRELKKRFGPEITDVLEYKKKAEAEIAELSRNDDLIDNLRTKIERAEERLVAEATRLSQKRKAAAKELSDIVTKELSELKMHQARFVVEVKCPDRITASDLGPKGIDKVEFLFRPNVGAPPKPISSIASGGELSRVMLALRSALSQKGAIETLIFDEIDAGLGGEVAEMVGKKLKNLAQKGQVITVTHFPQVAALADHHIVVSKCVRNGSTVTSVQKVGDEEERIEELARMLGGDRLSARRYAEDLIKRATHKKQHSTHS